MVQRVHRSLVKRAKKIDVDEVAYAAEEHVQVLRSVAKHARGVPGLSSEKKLKNVVKKIDDLEKEALKLEEKIDSIWEKRALLAVELEDMLLTNHDLLRMYVLDPFDN